MEWLDRLFSSGTDISRLNPAGIALMVCALALSALSGRIAAKIRPDQPVQMKNTLKTISLIICAGGALLAILG